MPVLLLLCVEYVARHAEVYPRVCSREGVQEGCTRQGVHGRVYRVGIGKHIGLFWAILSYIRVILSYSGAILG